MTIKQRFFGLFQSRFIRNVGILAGGTAFSQAVAILVLPFLTRLYTPEDFTVLAAYSSILGLLNIVACLRFEIAIPMPKDKDVAIRLLGLSLMSLIGVTLLISMGVFLYKDEIGQFANGRLDNYLWLLPVGVLLGGGYNALQFWATREKKFSLIAKTRMVQSVSGAVTQLGFGYAGVTPFGLLIGQVLNVGAGVFSLLGNFLKNQKVVYRILQFSRLKKTFKDYDRFPKYSTWEALTNSAGIQVPILIIAAFSVGAEAGFLMLAMRLLSVPMGLIGRSVAQVYLAEASDKFHEGELKSFTNKTILMLAKTGIIPLLIIGVSAIFFVPVIFGDDWYRTGVLISWMVPWFFMKFITSPVSMSLHITGNQKVALALQSSGFIFRGGMVWLSAIYMNSFVGEVYAITGFIFYTFYLIVIQKILNKNAKYSEKLDV